MQGPDIARSILRDGRGFQINAGLNRWSTIHIGDLGEVVNELVKAASLDKSASSDLWNDQGIYLPATDIVVSGNWFSMCFVAETLAELWRPLSMDHRRSQCSRIYQRPKYQSHD